MQFYRRQFSFFLKNFHLHFKESHILEKNSVFYAQEICDPDEP